MAKSGGVAAYANFELGESLVWIATEKAPGWVLGWSNQRTSIGSPLVSLPDITLALQVVDNTTYGN